MSIFFITVSCGILFGNYLIYLFFTDKEKFNDITMEIAHFTLKTISYIQIYSLKAKQYYIKYISPVVSPILLTIKNECTSQYNEFYKFIRKIKSDETKDETKDEKEITEDTNHHIFFIQNFVNHLDFIFKEDVFIYKTNKNEFLSNKNNSFPLFDFIIYDIMADGNKYHKIFYELPQTEENFNYSLANYSNIRSCTLISRVNDESDENQAKYENFSIQFVDKDYHYWIENNIINIKFLSYFLKKHYDIHMNTDELKNYHLQIITKDIDIYHINLSKEEMFQITGSCIKILTNETNNENDKEKVKEFMEIINDELYINSNDEVNLNLDNEKISEHILFLEDDHHEEQEEEEKIVRRRTRRSSK